MQRKRERHLGPNLHPIKRWPATGDSEVSALLGSGKSRAADSRPQTWPGEGRSLVDKGVGEKVRDATPRAEGQVHQAAEGAGPSALSGRRLASNVALYAPRWLEAPRATGPRQAERSPSGLRCLPPGTPTAPLRGDPGTAPAGLARPARRTQRRLR